MKSIVLFLAIVTSLSLSAQNNLKFEKVIQTDSVGKNKIFETINEWFASTYTSANDVIQMADKEGGIIVGNGSMQVNFDRSVSYRCYDGYLKYKIMVYVKDNRYKIVLTDFNHIVKAGNSQSCQLGFITNDEVFANKGLQKKFHNNIWNDIKAIAKDFFIDVVVSLENKTNTMSLDDDDW